jgi:polyisoprenoid-binding protein YceI
MTPATAGRRPGHGRAAVLMRVALLAALMAAVIFPLRPLAAEAPGWRLEPAASRLGFAGTQGGSPFEGRFERFTAEIRFDPADPATQRIIIRIDMASAQSGSRERDTTVKDADWFDVARHPEARFETVAVRADGDGRYLADADLTIRGNTRRVQLPFTLRVEGEVARAVGEVTIDRVDYGVGGGAWAAGDMVGRPVTIRFDITARRAG